MNLVQTYIQVREHTEHICAPLQTEDYVVQPIADVSPPKWHLGHSTWFFETFLLKPYAPNYIEFNPEYNFVFNSYYESVGARVIRTDRGNLSRPTVADIYKYRKYVDEAMLSFLSGEALSADIIELIVLGCNHEQQHQELLYSDIKYILGHNPLFPLYHTEAITTKSIEKESRFIQIPGGVYEIGFSGEGFCFDNELNRHKVYVQPYTISSELVTNKEYLEFIEAGGYTNFRYWHAEGWNYLQTNKLTCPLYWHNIKGEWHSYSLQGLQPLKINKPVMHVNFFEAAAYAAWKGFRLPTEAEWEIASDQFKWGQLWEWTNSAYLPYPGFSKAEGAVGEYNGKFMVNQMVLRGASIATPNGHSRITYRNFFQTHLQWQFTGIRLAQ